ncbi:MAG: hypothetical protein LBO72_02995 [Helicobacteraceae bacterium]|jgi:TPR repeat protein|nr:hypothetical protein [Helicobacteraceae bacterium]
MAIIYRRGRGVEASAQKYLEYYTKARDIDVSYCDYVFENLETCSKVAYAYEIGEGVKPDLKIAVDYYNKACKEDYYGWMRERAKIVQAVYKTNETNITKALEKNCEVNNDGFSCETLGNWYTAA